MSSCTQSFHSDADAVQLHLPDCQHGQNLKQFGFSLGTIRSHAEHVEKLLTIDREYNEPFTADRYCPESIRYRADV